jgi:hypothetical protein
LFNTTVIKLGECVHYDWLGHVTGSMYTFGCMGMWCNQSCPTPPCPMDYPCPAETYCCLNDPAYPVPCGTEAGCDFGSPSLMSWLLGWVRLLVMMALVCFALWWTHNNGYCNLCPWRRAYSSLSGEMA